MKGETQSRQMHGEVVPFKASLPIESCCCCCFPLRATHNFDEEPIQLRSMSHDLLYNNESASIPPADSVLLAHIKYNRDRLKEQRASKQVRCVLYRVKAHRRRCAAYLIFTLTRLMNRIVKSTRLAVRYMRRTRRLVPDA